MKALRIHSVGLSLSVLFAVSYVLCLSWDAIFPGWAMYQVWQRLFPGFAWSATGLLIGLVETVFYGYYIALIFVPVYNYLHRRERGQKPAAGQHPLAHA